MAKDYSPFTPGLPVPVDFFTGRRGEVHHLLERVKAATAGKLEVAFITGERGIGKSSLASFVRFVAERDYKTLGLHTFLGGVSSLEEMARRVFDRLLKESIGKTWEERIKNFFGNRIKQVGLFGVSFEFEAPEKDLRRMVHDFAPALRNLIGRLEGEKGAIFLVLDDINGLAESGDFANWLKSLVDEIATSREILPLCLCLVGLEERRQSLIRLQPSLARVFHVIEMKTWSDTETREFFNTTFSKVNVRIEAEAIAIMSQFSGGLPVLAHEIGDAVFKTDQDNIIDYKDALAGIIQAADIVGRKHLEPQVFRAIRSAKYRTILRKIAKEPFQPEFRVRDIRSRLSPEEERVFHNFLTRMKKLGVLQENPEGGPGAYRFGNRLHYLYFCLEAKRAKESREP